MLVNQSIIPTHTLKKFNNFFEQSFALPASRFISEGRLVISFRKGDPKNYLIVSGICTEDKPYETRVSLKNNKKIKTSCNCLNWTQGEHCKHSSALFLYYLLQEELDQDWKSTQSSDIGIGVKVKNFGTIIKNPKLLIGAHVNSTFASLQYILTNGKLAPFSIPIKNTKYSFNIYLDTSTEIFHDDEDDLQTSKFKLNTHFSIIIDNVEHKKISIFEDLYIFNWENGNFYELNSIFKDLFKTLKLNDIHDINEYLLLTASLRSRKFIKIIYNNINLNEVPETEGKLEIYIDKSEKNNYTYLKFLYSDRDSKSLPLPEFCKIFTFANGYLSTFKKKNYAYQFLKEYVRHSRKESNQLNFTLRNSYQKERIHNLIKVCESLDVIEIFDPNNSIIAKYEIKHFIEVIKLVGSIFTNLFYRFSKYNHIDNSINFEILNTSFLEGIAEFYDKTKNINVDIFYNKTKINTWKSSLKFERNFTSTNWFEVEFSLTNDDLAIINNSELGNNVIITSKGLVILKPEQQQLVRHMKRYTRLEKANIFEKKEGKKFIIPFNRVRIFELFELKNLGVEGALTDEEEQLCHNLANFEKMPSYEVPQKLTSVLREYQTNGFNWLRFLYDYKLGACLADDMGLGKTLQTIAFLQSIIDKVQKVLIVCPVSIVINWENEMQKFSDLKFCTFYGPNRALNDEKIIITSYGTMKKEANNLFNDIKFDILILDEVHHLKNIKSLGAIAARKLNADFRITLTGTPVENDLSEFYNILDLSVPGVWGDMQYVRTVSNKKSRLIARKTAKPFILRRTKDQVLHDLPEKIENLVYLNFTSGEKKNYIENLVKIQNEVTNSSSKNKYGMILKGLLKLRQLCLWQKTRAIESTKINFLLENLQQLLDEGHQAIIFSQFTTYLDIIQRNFLDLDWDFSRIDGTQNIKRRQSEVDKFQNSKTKLFLISLKAGGVGLNLTAASYVFLMDPWWNPAVENQAIDRAHRIGQKNKLTVYRPIVKDTVEEKVLKLQQYKNELFQDLMNVDSDSFYDGKLSIKDFEMLLS